MPDQVSDTSIQAIQQMITGRVGADTIGTYQSIARESIRSDGIQPDDRRYEVALLLYTCHLLYMAGFVRVISSESDGFVRNLYAVTPLTEYKGSSYIEMYKKIVGDPLIIIRI